MLMELAIGLQSLQNSKTKEYNCAENVVIREVSRCLWCCPSGILPHCYGRCDPLVLHCCFRLWPSQNSKLIPASFIRQNIKAARMDVAACLFSFGLRDVPRSPGYEDERTCVGIVWGVSVQKALLGWPLHVFMQQFDNSLVFCRL